MYVDDDGPVPSYNFDTSVNLSVCVINEQDVERKLSSLDRYKEGHWSTLLAHHLMVLFYSLLKVGVFLD